MPCSRVQHLGIEVERVEGPPPDRCGRGGLVLHPLRRLVDRLGVAARSRPPGWGGRGPSTPGEGGKGLARSSWRASGRPRRRRSGTRSRSAGVDDEDDAGRRGRRRRRSPSSPPPPRESEVDMDIRSRRRRGASEVGGLHGSRAAERSASGGAGSGVSALRFETASKFGRASGSRGRRSVDPRAC